MRLTKLLKHCRVIRSAGDIASLSRSETAGQVKGIKETNLNDLAF